MWASASSLQVNEIRQGFRVQESLEFDIERSWLQGYPPGRRVRLLWFVAVLRIHDILVWIRIRGSMPLTNGSGFGSYIFCHWPSRRQQKTDIKKGISTFTFWRYIYIIFQRQKVKKKSQNSRNQKSGFISLSIGADPDPGGPKTSATLVCGENLLLWTIRISTSTLYCNCYYYYYYYY